MTLTVENRFNSKDAKSNSKYYKQCKHIIDPANRKYPIQINPQAPNLKAKIKIHKPTTPIRPVINNIHAPTHKIAQHINHKLKDLVKLRFEYNITNTIQFAEN
jgi:hypothetical protein